MRGARMTVAGLFCAAAVALAGCSGGGRPEVPASSPPPAHAPSESGVTAAASPAQSPAATAPGAMWPGYHADPARTASVSGSVADPAKPGWSAHLGAAVYGQPVIAGNTVVVGTESDRVVALDRGSGRTLWSYSLGTPLTHVDERTGCGDIDPLGITSTLAIDSARGEVFAVGEVASGTGTVEHRLVGLNLSTGAVELSRDADPPLTAGESALHLLQRAGLAIANGRVYIGYGGNVGDCGLYHGWLVAAPETGGGALDSFEVAPDGQGGAIWLSGGAPAIGADGSVYVTTGNANPFPPGVDRLQYTESVVKLSPTLAVEAAYKDPTAGGDEDLATGNPVLLPRGLVFAVGKTDAGHLLRASDLSSVATISGVCGSDPDGGPAYDPATQRLFVPCRGGGIQVVDVATRRLGPKLQGVNGAPIVVGGKVWAATYNGGGLTEFDAASGAVVQRVGTGALPTFASPSYTDGVLFLGAPWGLETFG